MALLELNTNGNEDKKKNASLVYPLKVHLQYLVINRSTFKQNNCIADGEKNKLCHYNYNTEDIGYDIYGDNGLPHQMDKLSEKIIAICSFMMKDNQTVFASVPICLFSIIACYMQCIHSLRIVRKCYQYHCPGEVLCDGEGCGFCDCFFKYNGHCSDCHTELCDICFKDQASREKIYSADDGFISGIFMNVEECDKCTRLKVYTYAGRKNRVKV